MRFRSRAKAQPFSVPFVLGAPLALGVVLSVVGCTEEPGSFPPCLDPNDNFMNDCPALDAGALDGEASDEDGAPNADGSASDGGGDAPSIDGGGDGAQ